MIFWLKIVYIIYDSPPNLVEVVGATVGLILLMEEILKSCISYYSKYPIIYETSQVSDFELSTVGPRRFNCSFFWGDLMSQPL